VQQYNWLDERQFLIAVVVGMISPGPVVITATFVGYLVAGFLGVAGFHHRHFPAVLPARVDRRADSGEAPGER
jgi:chromate transport protein ChrA